MVAGADAIFNLPNARPQETGPRPARGGEYRPAEDGGSFDEKLAAEADRDAAARDGAAQAVARDEHNSPEPVGASAETTARETRADDAVAQDLAAQDLTAQDLMAQALAAQAPEQIAAAAALTNETAQQQTQSAASAQTNAQAQGPALQGHVAANAAAASGAGRPGGQAKSNSDSAKSASAGVQANSTPAANAATAAQTAQDAESSAPVQAAGASDTHLQAGKNGVAAAAQSEAAMQAAAQIAAQASSQAASQAAPPAGSQSAAQSLALESTQASNQALVQASTRAAAHAAHAADMVVGEQINDKALAPAAAGESNHQNFERDLGRAIAGKSAAPTQGDVKPAAAAPAPAPVAPTPAASVETLLPAPAPASAIDAASAIGATDSARAGALGATPAEAQAQRAALAGAQVGREIIRRFSGETTRFEMRLDPPDLGRVEVRMEVSRDHKVTALISAETPQALNELARHARELQQALQSAGLDLAENGLSFDLSERRGAPAQAERGGARAHGTEEPTETPAPALLSRPIGLEHWRGVRVDVMA